MNTVLTSTYWLVGRSIVEHEQSGAVRAEYGQELMKRLATDLTTRLGRGFSERNLELMRLFYLEWRNPQTVSAESAVPGISQTPSAKLLPQFTLPWSHYVRLMTVADLEARRYSEHRALRSGWSVRQLDRQIATAGDLAWSENQVLPTCRLVLRRCSHVCYPLAMRVKLNQRNRMAFQDFHSAWGLAE